MAGEAKLEIGSVNPGFVGQVGWGGTAILESQIVFKQSWNVMSFKSSV